VTGSSGFNSFDWSADSKGFFISNRTGLGSTQFFVDLNGKSHPLWQQRSSFLTWGVPSPNGRYLAGNTPIPPGVPGHTDKPYPYKFDVARAKPLSDYIAAEVTPGPAVDSETELLAFARQNGATIFHPAGTCRMGADDAAVVDPQLRVRGVEGLWVADCSIMPTLVSGNTNLPAIMIGEKASDLILQDTRQH